MKGMYFHFARLVIKLLVAIYENQLKQPGCGNNLGLLAEADTWLEDYK